jgi:hypothetical protein
LARRRVARAYLAGLGGRDFLDLPEDTGENGGHLFVVRLGQQRLSIDRNAINLPIYPSLTDEQLTRVFTAVREASEWFGAC